MEKEPFFSIIMPVYGVEKYLEEAIQSVLKQTYDNFELLLVDDMSPDSCPQICDEYAEKDSRIQVIHKPENQGLGMARNTGMERATGNYLFFVDSDDSIDPDTLQVVKDSLCEDTEILAFGMKRAFENKNGNITRVEEFSCEPQRSCNIEESGRVFLALSRSHLFPYVCNKAYNRRFLFTHHASFEKTKLIEDFLFNIYLFGKAEHITVIPNCFYNYRKPAHQTLVNTYSPQFYELAKRKFSLELEFLQITNNTDFDAKQTVLYSHIKHIVSVFLRNKEKSASLSGQQQRAAIRSILNDETTVSTLAEFVPQSVMQKSLCFILKHKMVFTCYVMVTIANLMTKV